MSDLAGLFQRVQHSPAADRAIDCAVAIEVGGFFTVEASKHAHEPLDYCYIDADGVTHQPGHGGGQLVPEYTLSADAALRLAGRLLPEHDYLIGHTNGGLTIHCQFGPNSDDMAFGETVPLAICAGLLKALLVERVKGDA